MDPIRVEFVIDHLNVGGAQRHLVELFSGLDRTRFAPQLCVAKPGGTLIGTLEQMGIPVRCFDLGPTLAEPQTLVGLARMARRLRAGHVDIVHGYLYMGNILGMLAGKLAGTPIRIAGKRSLDRYPRRAQLYPTRLANRFAHRILCNAKAVRQFVLQEERPAPRKFAVIPNGIRLPKTTVAPVRPAAVPEGARVVGTIGRLTWKKAYADLLEAARQIRTERPDVEFVIIGEGPLRADLEAQAVRLGIGDHVHFLGEVHDVRALLQGFDVFTLSSVIEGMPNVLLEAMAAEKPAVVTKAGGMPEMVIHEETGLLVPPAAPAALASEILRLLSRPEDLARFGKAGRRLVEKRFTVSAMISSYARLYEELTVERKLRRPHPAATDTEELSTGPAATGH
ncbi:MAG: glycosyltransferase [Planctomycetota bacterium]